MSDVTVLVMLAALLAGCGPSYTEPPDPLAARRREVVAHTGEDVVADLNDFLDAAQALEAATAAHEASGTAETLAAAQAAWTDAMAIWQRLEVVTMGPGAMSTFTDGLAMRDDIYSFPLTSTCRVDQETVEGSYTDEVAFVNENVNVRGLGAIEYLLFVPTTENTCLPTSPINTDPAGWAALTDVNARRADYAHTLAILIARAAERLRDAWTGGFLEALQTAGDGSPLFTSARTALDELSGALLYTDTMTKEMKIGEPASIIVCTTGPACLVELESRWSGLSKEHILINLHTFERVFLGAAPGTDAPGYDDLLIDAGQGQLASEMADAITAAIAAVDALPGTLEEAIIDQHALVMTAYDRIGDMLRLFKLDVFTALDIEISVVPTDND